MHSSQKYKHSTSNTETKYSTLVCERDKYRVIVKWYSIELSIPTKLLLELEISIRWYGIAHHYTAQSVAHDQYHGVC